MNRRTLFIAGTTFLLLVSAATSVAGAQPRDISRLAGRILNLTDSKGGLIVHVGCGDGKLTAALRAGDSYVVHGLDSDPENVAAARKHIKSLGRYGSVFVEQWSGGRLPYIDNSVNIVVSENVGVADSELMRVLAPRGVAYVRSGRQWTRTIKPRPEEIDEWTHYLHDPSNNAVAHDSVIEPPSRYQWLAGPRYSRQHDHMSSVSAVVSANGRLFYIFDEAHRASILIPPKWRLIARDAFNGKQLWERQIDLWHPHLWRLKSGPQMLARRLVAAGDRVYVTLGIDAPLSALNAATGETIRTYEGTKATEEVLLKDGVLILSVAGEGQPLRSDPKKRYASLAEMNKDVTNPLWTQAPRTIMALDADSGSVLWEEESQLVSLSLAADGKRVLFHDGDRIRCLDRHRGLPLWTSEPLPKKEPMRSSGGATLVLYDDVVLYSGQAPLQRRQPTTSMFALSIEDGKTLWQSPHHPCGHMGTPDDILVAGGLVWNGAVAKGNDSGIMTGREEGIRAGCRNTLVPSPLLPGKSNGQVSALFAHRYRIHRLCQRALDLSPLGARRVPLRHHAVQRADLRAAAPVCMLHRSEALRFHRLGAAFADNANTSRSAGQRAPNTRSRLRTNRQSKIGNRKSPRLADIPARR
ncbi:MAG: outer membrane protein assembly factor BamB family protein [Planctomycetota bacterium]|jgi:outer membrane protein assembly factor BamB